ncbi:MAG TPA: transglycosylase SLT domain-containing protein [Vitreimonas sp.]|uniref:transglycosylase SLT domain-containing protein n=1 Tax=Vitreimonas sp. TaxID=3069702 RepID=UPI002D397980|nr:transglycosylase SLT domain-containing protein [Vitreimonas sp.]HYD88290.1 transglycosylase SLT domain-containing protein [Vitreimonas sp.]
MSDPIASVGQEAVRAAIRRAADATGVDFSLLVETARRESALNPGARAGTSSATGLFQFIESTWLDMVRRHGPAHGLTAQSAALRGGADAQTRREILALRNDPELSARMAGELARENAEALQSRLGRTPTAGELYAAHVMGAGGALRLIEAAQNGAPDASALFPREAAANRGLFYAHGQARSAQGLLERLNLDASAGIAEPPSAHAGDVRGGQGISPALAQALFHMALLPLLRPSGGDERENSSLQAISAYARMNET